MNIKSKTLFFSGVYFRRIGIPSKLSPKRCRESIMTARSGVSGVSGGSSVAQEKLQRALANARSELHARNALQSESLQRQMELDIVSAEKRVLAVKVKELTIELDSYRQKHAEVKITGDELSYYKAELVKTMVLVKKAQINIADRDSRMSELESAIQSANATIARFAQQIEAAEQAHLEVREESDAVILLYETIAAVIKDMAIAIKIAVLRRDGNYSDRAMKRWLAGFSDQLDQLAFPAAVSFVIQSVTSTLTELIRPSTFLYDPKVKRILDAATYWEINGDISQLTRLIAESTGDDGVEYNDNGAHLLKTSPARMESILEFHDLLEKSIDFNTEFQDAAHLITYLAGLFDNVSDPLIGVRAFPDEPFPIPDNARPDVSSFYEALNILKSNIKALSDVNEIDLNHTSFAVALNEARSSIGRDRIQSRRTSVVADSQIIEENKALRAENEALKRRLAEQGSESDSPPDRVLSLAPLGQITRGEEWAQFFRTPFSPENSIGTEQDNGMIDDGNELNARIRGWVQSAGIGSSYTTDIASRGNSVAMVVNSLTPVAALADWSWVKEGVLDGSSEHVAAPVNPVQTDLPGGSLASFTTVGVDPSDKLSIEGSSKGAGVAKVPLKRKSANPTGSGAPPTTHRRVKSIELAAGVGKRSVSRSASMTSVNKSGSTGDKKEASNPAPPGAVMKGGRKK